MIFEKNHPYFYILRNILEKNTQRTFEYSFTFSKYIYIPNQVSDEREFIEVTETEFYAGKVEYLISTLNTNQELAFHSSVKKIYTNSNIKTSHIPMVDFSITPENFDLGVYTQLNQYMTKKTKNPILFNTGRSLHGYCDTLLSTKEWYELMGRLLLVDKIDRIEPIIDTRWIGHRIIAGYSALRWSNNSGKYLSSPYLYENIKIS